MLQTGGKLYQPSSWRDERADDVTGAQRDRQPQGRCASTGAVSVKPLGQGWSP